MACNSRARALTTSAQRRALAPAAADADIDRVKAELGVLAAPEQFYGDNFLRLIHEPSGTTIRCAGQERACRHGGGWVGRGKLGVRRGSADQHEFAAPRRPAPAASPRWMR